MNEVLIIRLGSDQADGVHWLIWDKAAKAIIASGELANANELSRLTEKAQQRPVLTLVPGCDVQLKALTLPGNTARTQAKMVPFMLEDELSQDVDQLHFAFATKFKDAQDHNCGVAAVSRDKMTNWLSWLKAAELRAKVMLPDYLALPLTEGKWAAVQLGEQLILRQKPWQGLTVEMTLWPTLAPRLDADTVHHIESYSVLEATVPSIVIDAQPAELPLAVMAEELLSSKFNLLQGRFAVKDANTAINRHWLWVAGLAAIALLLNVFLKVSVYQQATAQQEAIETEILSLYKEAFPDSKRVRISTVRSQIRQRLSDLGQQDQQSGFLSLLMQVEPAFSKVPQLKPQSMKFDSKRNELRIQATADSYQQFEQFKLALEADNLTVEQGALNNQGEQVTGSISIKGNV